MRRITDDAPRPIRHVNPEIPIWLEQIIMQLLHKDRQQRFQSAEEVSDLLGQWLAHLQQPNDVAPPHPIVSSYRQYRPVYKWFVAIGLGGMVAWLTAIVAIQTAKGTITIESEADNIPIVVTRNEHIVQRLTIGRDGESIRVWAGEYELAFDQEPERMIIENDTVTLGWGGKATVRVRQIHSDLGDTIEIDETRSDSGTSGDAQVRTVYYPVADFVDTDKGLTVERQLNKVAAQIRGAVEPESWSSPDVSIKAYLQNHTLLITQSAEAHRAIEKLLKNMRMFQSGPWPVRSTPGWLTVIDLKAGDSGRKSFEPPPGTRSTVKVGGIEFAFCYCPTPEVRVAFAERIANGFWIGETEVTQSQYETVVGANPSFSQGRITSNDPTFHREDTRNNPVEQVSWHDAVDFCVRLSRIDPDHDYRLPTEQEWEYACRAGTEGPRYGKVENIAWVFENTDAGDGSIGPMPVARLEPNPWGLYDMLGKTYPNGAMKSFRASSISNLPAELIEVIIASLMLARYVPMEPVLLQHESTLPPTPNRERSGSESCSKT